MFVTTSIFNLYCYKLEQVSSQYILQVAVILLFILVNNEINSKKNKITFVVMKYIFFLSISAVINISLSFLGINLFYLMTKLFQNDKIVIYRC